MNQATLIHEETLQGPWDRAVRSFKEETDFFHAPISPEIHGLQSVQDLIGRWNQLGQWLVFDCCEQYLRSNW